MCKFMQSLSSSPEIIGLHQPAKNLEMFLKPCKEGEFYRVRLLGFNSKDGSRVDPHITRMVHSSWETDPNTGKKRLVKLVCPFKTPWVEVDGNKKNSCRVCSYVTQQWAIYTESGRSDKAASANASRLRSNFEAVVPVYVVNDPNYERNSGKCKVIVFDDQKKYSAFRDAIKLQTKMHDVFNGVNAVDCLIYVGTEPIERKNGTIYEKTAITKIKFSTKPYDIPAITSKLIDSFPYDETYHVQPSQEEIDEFYNKFCAITNDDIPDDDDIPVYKAEPKKHVEKVEIPTNSTPKSNDVSIDDIDDIIDEELKSKDDSLADDPENEGLDAGIDLAAEKTSSAKKPSNDDVDSEDFLSELGF